MIWGTLLGYVASKEPEKEEQVITHIIRIGSNPDGADIFINNLKVGETPFSAKFAEGKELKIVIKKNKYKIWQDAVTISEEMNISAQLEKIDEEKVTKTKETEIKESSTWYYWVAGGAAVIGGVTYYLIAAEKDDGKSQSFPLPPGRPGN